MNINPIERSFPMEHELPQLFPKSDLVAQKMLQDWTVVPPGQHVKIQSIWNRVFSSFKNACHYLHYINPNSAYNYVRKYLTNQNSATHDLKTLLMGANVNITPVSFPVDNRVVKIPDQFARDITRVARLSVNGEALFSLDGNPPIPKPSENPGVLYELMRKKLGISERALNNIGHFANQAGVANLTIEALQLLKAKDPQNELSQIKGYWDFTKSRDQIKVTYNGIFECFRVDEEGKKVVGYKGICWANRIPLSELDCEIPKDIEKVAPNAKSSYTIGKLHSKPTHISFPKL